MFITDNFIEDAKVKAIKGDISIAVNAIESELEAIKEPLKNKRNAYNTELLRYCVPNMYTPEFIEEKKKELDENFDKDMTTLYDDLINKCSSYIEKFAKDTVITIEDKEASNRNLIKLNSIMNNLTIEDIKRIFEESKEKDLSVIQTLYYHIKGTEPMLAVEMGKYIEEFTGERKRQELEGIFNTIKGMNIFLNIASICQMDKVYKYEGGSLNTGINKIIDSYIEKLDQLKERC